MARNTSVSLGDHFTSFIDEQVNSGRYSTASDVIRAGLRLLESHDQQDAWLRTRMAGAQDQVRNGNIHEDTDEFWTQLDREVDEGISRGDRPGPGVCP